MTKRATQGGESGSAGTRQRTAPALGTWRPECLQLCLRPHPHKGAQRAGGSEIPLLLVYVAPGAS